MPRAAPVTTATGLMSPASGRGQRAVEQRRPARRSWRRASTLPRLRSHLAGLPARRWTISASPLRRATGAGGPRGALSQPATARSIRTTSGSMANINEVSVLPAWASPPRTPAAQISTGSPSARHRSWSSASPSWLPPWAEIRTTPANASRAERTSSSRRSASTSWLMSSVPGNARVLATGAIGHRGRHDDIGAGTGEPGRQLHGDAGVRVERQVRAVLFE